MAIFFFSHTQKGKDAGYLQDKIENIINAKGASVLIQQKKNSTGTSAIQPGYKDSGMKVYLDPALDTTQTIDTECKTTLASVIQSIINDLRKRGYSEQVRGGTVSVWEGKMLVFVVPDATFDVVSAHIAAIKGIS